MIRGVPSESTLSHTGSVAWPFATCAVAVGARHAPLTGARDARACEPRRSGGSCPGAGRPVTVFSVSHEAHRGSRRIEAVLPHREGERASGTVRHSGQSRRLRRPAPARGPRVECRGAGSDWHTAPSRQTSRQAANPRPAMPNRRSRAGGPLADGGEEAASWRGETTALELSPWRNLDHVVAKREIMRRVDPDTGPVRLPHACDRGQRDPARVPLASRVGALSNDIASVPMVDPTCHAQGGLQQGSRAGRPLDPRALRTGLRHTARLPRETHRQLRGKRRGACRRSKGKTDARWSARRWSNA